MDCDLYEIWRRYEEPDVFFCINGPISQDLLVEICDTVARKMKLDNSDTNTRIAKYHPLFGGTRGGFRTACRWERIGSRHYRHRVSQ